MTHQQLQFLELLKAGLWGHPATPAHFLPEGTDWNEILKIAKEQTVLVVVLDGIETLPQELWPSKEAMMKLLMMRIKTSQMHQLLNNTLNLIVNTLNKNGIPSVLLKGQGVAQNYLKPESRSCGDIDLYTGIEGYQQACTTIETLDISNNCNKKVESDHHMHQSVNGVEIEVHRHAGMMPGKKLNDNFQKWTKESIDEHFGTNDLSVWNNNGTCINLATHTFDAFFILHHAVRHMTTGGIGFRQICDWTMYLHRHHASINTEILRNKLHDYRMTDVWEEFGIIAVNYLGLPINELPLAPTSLESSKTRLILDQIFISGNFGHADAHRKYNRGKTYIKRKWRDFSYQSSRLIMLFRIFPSYTCSYATNWFLDGLRRLLAHQ